FLGGQRLLAFSGQPVVAGALLVFGRLPFGRDEPLLAQAMQRGVERPVIDLQNVVRSRADGQADAVPVLRTPLKGAQDQHVQRALQKVDPSHRWLDVYPLGWLAVRIRIGRRESCSGSIWHG